MIMSSLSSNRGGGKGGDRHMLSGSVLILHIYLLLSKLCAFHTQSLLIS